MTRPIADQIGTPLASLNGKEMPICIFRIDRSIEISHKGSVEEWLSMPENQSGLWLIDGGWGGPPGAIHVRWNAFKHEWVNGGYCGVRFIENR